MERRRLEQFEAEQREAKRLADIKAEIKRQRMQEERERLEEE